MSLTGQQTISLLETFWRVLETRTLIVKVLIIIIC